MALKLSLRIVVATSLIAFSCSKKSADSGDDDSDTTTVTGNGTSTSGTTLNVATGNVAVNIGTVQEGMVPGSLAAPDGANLLGSGPCEGTDGFFDCQPNLIKLYLGMGKSMVGTVGKFVKTVSIGLFKNVKVPTDGIESCGSVTASDAADGIAKVEYCVTSETHYKALIHSAAGPFIYLTVDGTTYDITLNAKNAPDKKHDSDGPSAIHATVTYTDADTFGVDVELAGAPCKADDLRAPDRFALKIGKDDGVWKGKSMLYLPRWLFSDSDGVTCATESNDAMAMAFYTDYVGNDDGTTASIYFLKRTVTALDNIASYEVSDFCANYPNMCDGQGKGFGDPNVIATTYTNPFCVSGDTTTWGGACKTGVPAIDTPIYSDAGLWKTPAEMKELTITIPESL